MEECNYNDFIIGCGKDIKEEVKRKFKNAELDNKNWEEKGYYGERKLLFYRAKDCPSIKEILKDINY